MNTDPTTPSSFGIALQACLGGTTAKRGTQATVARLIGVKPQHLNVIVTGKRTPTQEWVNRTAETGKTLRQALLEVAPQHCTIENLAHFDRAALGLSRYKSERAGSKAKEPADAAGIGKILWYLLRQTETPWSYSAAAGWLQARDAFGLQKFISGQERPSQKWMAKRKWPEVLAEKCPDSWQKAGAIFTGAFLDSPRDSAASKTKYFDDWRESFAAVANDLVARHGDTLTTLQIKSSKLHLGLSTAWPGLLTAKPFSPVVYKAAIGELDTHYGVATSPDILDRMAAHTLTQLRDQTKWKGFSGHFRF